jgi:type II secretory pathway component GspD/PulD (secretin)
MAKKQTEPKDGQIAMHKGDKTLFVNDRKGCPEQLVKHGWSVDKDGDKKTSTTTKPKTKVG